MDGLLAGEWRIMGSAYDLKRVDPLMPNLAARMKICASSTGQPVYLMSASQVVTLPVRAFATLYHPTRATVSRRANY